MTLRHRPTRWQTLRRSLCALVAGAVVAAGAAPTLAQVAATPAPTYDGISHPDWVKDAAIYEINLRHFTRAGTLAAAQRELPRLKALGVEILWLMPIHPVGRVKPAGPLGSPYAVRDFRAVDPAYGTLADLRSFTAAAHAQGLKVILDWVGNHSAWDNPLVTEHPDWYARDAAGRLHSPSWFGWPDVVEFDYAAPGLRRYMADSMAFWVREADVDGFRADAAGLTPLEFWESTAAELRAIKPVFMLAEWESRDLHFQAFDMTYGWTWVRALEAVAAGKGDLGELRTFYAWDEKFWPKAGIRMLYVSNHDANAWQGTEYERFGPALDAAIALSVVSEGMPLIYNGQEAGNRRRLKLFERDPIVWAESAQGDLYRRLLTLKKEHPALWNRPWGGPMVEVANNDQSHILSFTRTRDGDAVLAVFNFSAQPRPVTLTPAVPGEVWRASDGRTLDLSKTEPIRMPPWSYQLYFRRDGAGQAKQSAGGEIG